MPFNFENSMQVLKRTPTMLKTMLQGLSKEWTDANEGDESWTVREVVAHLEYCDRHNWLLRARHLLQEGTASVFPAFDRFAHLSLHAHRDLNELLDLFIHTRQEVLQEIESWQLATTDYEKKGLHPQFGEVQLSQLWSAWTVHDLSHTAQVLRIMAGQYREAVGPWVAYLRILQ